MNSFIRSCLLERLATSEFPCLIIGLFLLIHPAISTAGNLPTGLFAEDSMQSPYMNVPEIIDRNRLLEIALPAFYYPAVEK